MIQFLIELFRIELRPSEIRECRSNESLQRKLIDLIKARRGIVTPSVDTNITLL